MRQGGFAAWVYLIGVIVLLGMVSGLAYSVHNAGYVKGRAEVQADWDKASREARDEQDRARQVRESDALRAATELAAAQQSAREWESKWRRERTPAPLATVSCPEGPAPAPVVGGGAGPAVLDAGGVGLRPRGVVRLTAEFVRRYDGIWTGAEGSPVFQHRIESLEAAVAARPIGLDELLDTHGENASRCSETARQLTKLIDFIEVQRAKEAQ